MEEKWRYDYHDQNFDRELSHEDMKCKGCGTPFGYSEQVEMINDDPYCHDSCFMQLQKIEYWNTKDAPTPEQLLENRWNSLSKAQKDAILWFADLHEIDIDHNMRSNKKKK